MNPSPGTLRKWVEKYKEATGNSEMANFYYSCADAWDIETARADGWKALAMDYAKQITALRKRLEAAEKVVRAARAYQAWHRAEPPYEDCSPATALNDEMELAKLGDELAGALFDYAAPAAGEKP